MYSKGEKGSERRKECPKNIPRSERNVVENMKVKVRQDKALTELTSSVNYRSKSSEVD